MRLPHWWPFPPDPKGYTASGLIIAGVVVGLFVNAALGILILTACVLFVVFT